MVVTCTLSSASPQIQLGFNISNSFSSARSSPSRLVRGQRSKTGSGPSATFLPRISLTWVVYGGLIGALNDFSIFQYLQNDSTEGLRM